MQQLTQNGTFAVENLSRRYGVSVDAVRTMLFAVAAGGGSMAQFYHSELGGGGQWMRGGMTMVGDMFNHGLQATVANLCSELSQLLGSQQLIEAPVTQPDSFGGYGNNWWPGDLGSPSSSGGQNDSRYAYFPGTRRLAIDRAGHVTIYDTLDHHIGGVQQQQGGAYGSLSFGSQFGTFSVESLPVVSGGQNQTQPQSSYQAPSYQEPAPSYQAQAPSYQEPAANFAPSFSQNTSGDSGHDAILATIERLSDLHKKGILSDDEFRSKKAELLGRL